MGLCRCPFLVRQPAELNVGFDLRIQGRSRLWQYAFGALGAVPESHRVGGSAELIGSDGLSERPQRLLEVRFRPLLARVPDRPSPEDAFHSHDCPLPRADPWLKAEAGGRQARVRARPHSSALPAPKRRAVA